MLVRLQVSTKGLQICATFIFVQTARYDHSAFRFHRVRKFAHPFLVLSWSGSTKVAAQRIASVNDHGWCALLIYTEIIPT
jgi:hypothetical protein